MPYFISVIPIVQRAIFTLLIVHKPLLCFSSVSNYHKMQHKYLKGNTLIICRACEKQHKKELLKSLTRGKNKQ